MRWPLAPVLALSGLCAGCVSSGRYAAQVAEAEALRQRSEAAEAQVEGLLNRLASLEGAHEALAAERAEAAAGLALLARDLRTSEAERRALEEHASQLTQRERELSAVHAQLSEVWYRQALARARRGSAPPQPAPPPATPPAVHGAGARR